MLVYQLSFDIYNATANIGVSFNVSENSRLSEVTRNAACASDENNARVTAKLQYVCDSSHGGYSA